MSKSSIVCIAMAAAFVIPARNLIEQETAVAGQHPRATVAQGTNTVGSDCDCPCFKLEDLATVQWSTQVANGPRYKEGPPLWSIVSRAAGAVNAASVHSDLDSCVLLIEFGPNASVFRADLHLTPAQEKECIKIIGDMRGTLKQSSMDAGQHP